MNLKTPLELPIYWNDEHTCNLEDLGIKSNNEPEIKLVFFLSINHFFKCKINFNDKDGAAISSGTQEFVFAGTYEELKQIILDNLSQTT